MLPMSLLPFLPVVDEDFSVGVSDAVTLKGNSVVLRCEVNPPRLRPWVQATSWLHEEGAPIEIRPEPEPRGKYTVLNSGHLLVHHTSAYDSYKRYTCKARHRLTGQRRRSLAAARLTLKGEKEREREGPFLLSKAEQRGN